MGEIQMEDYRKVVLEFDTTTGKCRLNGGVAVYFKGCTSEERFQEELERQKERDREKPPPPEPTDRDGYMVCKVATGATFRTWHYCSTLPPYTCTNLGTRC
jgi:hypothetical protein